MGNLSAIRLLIVDDMPANLVYFKRVLSKLGISIDTFSDARDALKSASEKDYHILLVDIQMPQMSGLDFCREFRQKINVHTPLVLITAHDLKEEDIKEIFESGASDLIQKPIHPDKLYYKMRAFLDTAMYFEELRLSRNDAQQLNHMLIAQAEEIRNLKDLLHFQPVQKEAGENYRTVFRLMNQAVIVLSDEYKILDANQKALEISGYKISELRTQNASILFAPEQRKEISSIINQLANGLSTDNELLFVRRDSQIKSCHVTVSPSYWDSKPAFIMLVSADSGANATKLDVQPALQVSEEKFRQAFSINPAYMMIYDLNSHVIWDVNQAFEEGLKYAKNELIGRDIRTLDIFQKDNDFSQALSLLETEKTLSGHDLALKDKNNQTVYGRIFGKSMFVGDFRLAIFVITNISALKKAEQNLLHSREQLQFALENSQQGVWSYNSKTNEIQLSRDARKIMRIKNGVGTFKLFQFVRFIITEDRAKIEQKIRSISRAYEEKIIALSFRIIDKEDIRWILCKGKAHFKANSFEITGILTDISQQKHNEEAALEYQTTLQFMVGERTAQLAESDKKLRNIYENIQDIYFETRLDGRILDISPSIKQLGFGEFNIIIGQNIKQFYFDSNDRDIFLKEIKKKKQLIDYEIDFRNKKGGIVNYSLMARLLDDNGQQKITGSLRNISSRKIAENKLHVLNKKLENEILLQSGALVQSQKAYKELYDNIPIGLYRVSPEGEIHLANPYLIKLMGCDSLDELKRFDIPSSYTDPQRKKDFDEKMQKDGYVRGFEAKWYNKNKEVIVLRENATCIYDERGNIEYYEGTVEDVSERHHITQKLQHNEQLLNAIFDGMQSGLSLINKDLQIIKTNYWLREHFNFNDNSTLPCHELLFGLKEACKGCPIRQTLKDGKSRSTVIRHSNKNKQKIWYEISVYPVKNKHGEVVKLIHDIRNVNARIQAERFLEHKEKFNELILDLAASYVNSSHNQIADCHKTVLKKTALFIGAHWAQIHILDRENKDSLKKTNWQKNTNQFTSAIIKRPENCQDLVKSSGKSNIRILRGEDLQGFFQRFKTQKPEDTDTIVCLPLSNKKDIIGFLMFGLSNITTEWQEQNIPLLQILTQIISNAENRIITEQNLQNIEQRYRLLFENAPIGVFQSIPGGEILEYNEEVARIGGFKSLEEAQKHSAQFFDYIANPEDYHKMNKELKEKREIKNRQVRIKGPDGKNRWIYVSLRLSYNETHKKNLVDGFVIDITDQKTAERKIRESLDKLRELNDLKTNFVSMVSHELRTPLTGIRSSTDIINHYIADIDEEKKKNILKHNGYIKNEIDRLTQVMEDVLLIGKIDADQIEMKYEELNILELITNLAEMNFSNQKDKRTLQIKCFGEPYAIIGDKNLLTQVFNNLISNAFKYSQDKKAPEAQIDFRQKKAVCIRITDYGIGIPENEADKIFDSFYRATNVSTISGTGLGMHIVKRNLVRHGGSIQVKSHEGKGSTFIINLPQAPKQQ